MLRINHRNLNLLTINIIWVSLGVILKHSHLFSYQYSIEQFAIDKCKYSNTFQIIKINVIRLPLKMAIISTGISKSFQLYFVVVIEEFVSNKNFWNFKI